MDDSDSELLSDSDENIDIVARANKAKPAFNSGPAKAEPAEKQREEKENQRQREEEERKQLEEEERKKREEEKRQREEAEAERQRQEKLVVEKKRQEEEAERERQEEETAREAEEAEEEEEEVEGEDEEEVEAVGDDTGRNRSKSTFHETHHAKMKELQDKEMKDKMEAEKNMQNFSKGVVHFKSEADKQREKEKERLIQANQANASKKADVKNEFGNSEKRLTEFKNARKKGKKKKAWKPLIHGYVTVVSSSFKMKKGRDHKIDKDQGHYMALQLLPQSCNIDETEAEWTKNKKSDALVPALVAFSNQEKYDAFASKVAGKNMKTAAGLMLLARFASGICHLRDEFAIGADVASAIATLKTDFVRSEAVLPVDSYRGGDSGEENQFVLVDRKQAFVLVVDDDQFTEWQEKLKSAQPRPVEE